MAPYLVPAIPVGRRGVSPAQFGRSRLCSNLLLAGPSGLSQMQPCCAGEQGLPLASEPSSAQGSGPAPAPCGSRAGSACGAVLTVMHLGEACGGGPLEQAA